MKTYLDLSDIKLMEQATTCLRDRLLVRILSRLGCRVSEAIALKVNDIDFERKTVTILHLKRIPSISCPRCKERLGTRHQFCPGCGAKISNTVKSQQEKRRVRVLPVDEDTIEMLKNYLNQNKSITDNSVAPIFRLNRHRAWQIVRDSAKRVGLSELVNPETGRIKGISPHRLRDAFSVHAMKIDDSGDALRLLQERLGHASFNTTAKYRKVAGEEHRRWYDRLWKETN